MLARTAAKAIILPPEGRSIRQHWHQWLTAELPAFTWNYRRGQYEAPLIELVNAYNTYQLHYNRPPLLTQGAYQYLKENDQ